MKLTVAIIFFCASALLAGESTPKYTIPDQAPFDRDYGERLPGDVLNLNEVPGANVRNLTGQVDNGSAEGWTGNIPFTCAIPGKFAGVHQGKFSGSYSRDGSNGSSGSSGSSPKWNGAAKALVVKIDLKQVAFKGTGYFPIVEDDGSPIYRELQWQDNSAPLNRSAEESGDKKYPVGYKRNVKPFIGAIFHAKADLPSGTTTTARATGTGGLNIPETACSISGSVITLPNTEVTAALPNSVQFYDTFNFQWQVKINNGSWRDVGTSKNRMFVTIDTPVTSPVYYSVAYHACRTAIGEAFMELAVPKIWTAFSTGTGSANTMKVTDSHPDISPCENRAKLKYYNPWLSPGAGSIGDRWPAIQLGGLLLVNNGQCTSWNDFWIACLEAHEFAGGEKIRVTPQDPYAGFLVKTWNLIGPGSNTDPATRALGLWWAELPEPTKLVRVARDSQGLQYLL